MTTDFYYQTFKPSEALRPYIEHLWALKADNRDVPQRQILIPSGRPSLVLCLGDPGTRLDPLTSNVFQNENVCFGIATRPFILDQRGVTCYVGVQFTAFGLAAFCAETLRSNEFNTVDELFGAHFADLLLKSVKEVTFGKLAVARLDKFLAKRCVRIAPKDLNRLQRSIQIIDKDTAMTSSLLIARTIGISPSTLRRLFRAYIGVSPEQLIGITRYAMFVKDLVRNDTRPNAIFSALHGFYDEPHAAKDFKRYTGLNRRDFVQSYDGIARLMYENND